MINGLPKFKNNKLLVQALTHSSYSAENYERLEFLGDSILGFIVADLFYKNSSESVGYMTKKRAHFVAKPYLAIIFDSLNLEKHVRLGKSTTQVTQSMKCDMMESVLAAIYLDLGLDTCRKFIYEHFDFEIIDNNNYSDSKTILQEWSQKNKTHVEYKLLNVNKKARNKSFIVRVKVFNYLSTARAGSIKEAEQLAAKKILKQIDKGANWCT